MMKFRVWDKQDNHMHYMPAAELYENFVLRADGVLCLYEPSKNGDIPEVDANRYEASFSTGLIDCEGKEIWEGDYISVHQFLFDGNEVESELTGLVSWDKKTVAFYLSNIRNQFYQNYTGYGAGEGTEPICLMVGLHEESFKVIGNRFQNPELLGVKE